MVVNPLVQALAKERRLRGLKVVDVVRLSGLKFSAQSLAQWENGEYLPKLQALSDWAEALGCELGLRRKS